MRQVALSIEATGSEACNENRVVEIGCIELVDGQMTGKHFHVYLDPGMSINGSSLHEVGITDEFLTDKPKFVDIAKEFSEFVGEDELVVYEADFVLGVLGREFNRSGLYCYNKMLGNKIVDLKVIGEERHQDQNNSLASLCERYYVDSTTVLFSGALLKAEQIAELVIALNNDSTKKIISDLSKYEEGENLIVIKTFSDLDEAIEGIGNGALCRGVSNHEYPLLPSLFRHQDVDSADSREHKLMWVFKTHAKPYLDSIPANEIEWLTIAQHHGLPTRLLDWSLSPLVACFFAVQSLTSSDAAIYIYDIGGFEKEESIDASKLSGIVAFIPSHATKRVAAQSGMFTIHPTGSMKLESESIKKLIIPADRKRYFLKKLIKYGVHQGTVFPDLDGLSAYLKYLNGFK